jgi:hypothetical protein
MDIQRSGTTRYAQPAQKSTNLQRSGTRAVPYGGTVDPQYDEKPIGRSATKLRPGGLTIAPSRPVSPIPKSPAAVESGLQRGQSLYRSATQRRPAAGGPEQKRKKGYEDVRQGIARIWPEEGSTKTTNIE